MVLKLAGLRSVTTCQFSEPFKIEESGETNPKQRSGFVTKKRKFTEEQIAFAQRQAKGRTSVGEACRKMGIFSAMFYNWEKKYGGRGVANLVAER